MRPVIHPYQWVLATTSFCLGQDKKNIIETGRVAPAVIFILMEIKFNSNVGVRRLEYISEWSPCSGARYELFGPWTAKSEDNACCGTGKRRKCRSHINFPLVWGTQNYTSFGWAVLVYAHWGQSRGYWMLLEWVEIHNNWGHPYTFWSSPLGSPHDNKDMSLNVWTVRVWNIPSLIHRIKPGKRGSESTYS